MPLTGRSFVRFSTAVRYSDLYQRYLGRAADPAGLTAFVQQLAAGGTVDQVKASLLGSDEYFAGHDGGTNDGFLAALYQDVLGRPIDPAGQAGLGALIGLLRREDVAAVVLASTERKTVLLSGSTKLCSVGIRRRPSSARFFPPSAPAPVTSKSWRPSWVRRSTSPCRNDASRSASEQ